MPFTTKANLELWADLCARFPVAGGLRAEHTVQIAFGYGLFTGGLGLHYGAEKVVGAVFGVAVYSLVDLLLGDRLPIA